MTRHSFHRVAAGGISFLLLSSLPGCSVFQSSRAIDMTPFAENTAAIFAEAAKVSRPFKFRHLRPYADIPERQEVLQKSTPLVRGLRGVVMYSNQLVALNLTAKPDKEKNKLLAAYFKEAAGKVAERKTFDSIGVSTGMLDTVFMNIEAAETFREGIEAASPLVNAVVLALLRGVDEIDAAVPKVIAAVDQQIEKDYADKRRNYQALVRLQTQLHYAVTLLYDGQSGNREALQELLEVDHAIREFLPFPDKAGPREFKAAEDALTSRLERIALFLHQLDGEKVVYAAKQQELADWRANIDERVKIARDAIMVWGQSHRNLGAGIAVPPLIDVAGIAGGLAKKVVPLP